MSFDPDIVKKQVIANLNLSVRDAAGTPTYDTNVGDLSYSPGQIDRAVLSAAVGIATAIAETDGHPHRGVFTASSALTHGAALPAHFGSAGVPDITPYTGAAYTIKGKRRSVEEVSAYRANPGNIYSATAHNALNADLGTHSKLAGFYAIDNNVFHFTGFSASAMLATVTETTALLIPEIYHHLAVALAIANLRTDGDLSDIFSHYAQEAAIGLDAVRAQGADQPSMKKTIGANRDSAAK